MMAELTDTLFLRNLSYDTEQDDLKKLFSAFGDLEYCLICKNKGTGESKGTGFVKFKDPEVAAKCLADYKDFEQQAKFHLDGRNIVVLPALSRYDVSQLQSKEKERDKRNLYLAHEGAILPSSDVAQGVSKDDMKKRMALEERKRKLLTNLHYFVSTTRLCIHNLPPNVDEKKLKNLLLGATGNSKDSSVKLTEFRIMKNKKGKGTDSKELGKSKGFAFAEFTKHEHALNALRYLNNNPNVFTPERRPIVEFSLENRVALNKKKVRLIKSLRTLEQKGQLKRKEVLQELIKGKKSKNKSKLPAHLTSAGTVIGDTSVSAGDAPLKKKKTHYRRKTAKKSENGQEKPVTAKPQPKKKNPIAAPEFGGLMSRPPKPNEPVRVPKLNRKFWKRKSEAMKKTKKDKKGNTVTRKAKGKR